MKSAVSANLNLTQDAREIARQAARRAGLSVDEWLSLLVDSAGGEPSAAIDRGAGPADNSLAALRQRLNDLSSRLGSEGRPRVEAFHSSGLRELETRLTDLAQNISRLGDETPRRVAESITRLNSRLDQLIVDGQTASSEFERRISAVDRALSELGADPACRVVANWSNIEDAAAEIEARQRMIDGQSSGPAASPSFLDGLEHQLRYLTKQMENLRRPCSAEDMLADLRRDLSQISRTLSQARPRSALDALESELQGLSTRVNDGRRFGNDTALAGVERSLTQVYDAIANLAPAENLSGIEESVERLERKIDVVASTTPTPAAMRQLENAVAELRALSLRVASGQALDNLTDEVRALADKVDRLVEPSADAVSASSDRDAPSAGDLGELRDRYMESNRFARASLELGQGRERNPATGAAPASAPMEPGEKQARSSNGSAPLAPEEAAPAAARATGAFAFASSLVKTREPVGKDTISPPSPDQPLEPGSGVPPGLAISPAERIAASEAALGAAKPPKPAEPEGRANFIAAARRAAQAAAAEAADANKAGANDEKTRKRRVTLLGAGAIVLLAGSAQLAYNVFGDSSTLLGWSKGNVKETSAPNKPAVSKPAQTAASGPKLSPTTSGSASPPERPQMSLVQATDPVAFAAPAAGVLSIAAAHDVAPVPNAVPVATVPIHPTEVTGSAAKSPVTAALPELTIEPASPGDDGLPESIGGPRLKAAAQANDPAAQYEIAVRYAEGRNVRPSLEEAARWFERAANQGLAPAQYRLGSLYEKGRGVKKDLTIARRLYQAAADKGNGKAMHNLAVLHADGVDGKPDYKTAVQWFRKAAARGVVDSQYNLGILYARGIGVEQSLAESYKWFMLAAQQGDPDAGRKRDDVAVRLDPQSLVAAKLAAQTFTPEPQPPEAVAVKAPSGGWDRVGAAPAGAPPKTKGTGSKKTAS